MVVAEERVGGGRAHILIITSSLCFSYLHLAFSMMWITLAYLNTTLRKRLESLSFMISVSSLDTSWISMACSRLYFCVAGERELRYECYPLVLFDGVAAADGICVADAPWNKSVGDGFF